MAQRRRAAKVTLTSGQRERLERLWFYYGNYGPKTTPGNHGFIQGILEHGIDVRPLHSKRTPKSEIPTPECERAVDEALTGCGEQAAGDERTGAGRLRVLSSPEARPRGEVDPEIKAMLDEIRERVKRDQHGDEDDTPEAA